MPTSVTPTPAESLNRAIQANDPDEVRYWLIAGASLTLKVAQSGGTASALNRWVASGPLSFWPVLKAYAIPVINKAPRNSFAPLSVAAKNDRIEVMPLLLAAGATLDGEMDGNNPLMCAVRYKAARAMVFLIERGARIDVRTSTGNSVLHEALMHQGQNLWAPLMEAGADAAAINRNGQSVPAMIHAEFSEDRRAALNQAWEAAVLRHAMQASIAHQALPMLERGRL